MLGICVSFARSFGGYMKSDNFAVRFLYQTCIGRFLLKGVIRPKFSKLVFHYLDSPFSKWMIKNYIIKYHIDMRQYEKRKYSSFNDFFIRKKKNTTISEDNSALISPCEGYLSVYSIDTSSRFVIKNTEYSVASLLKNEVLAKDYQDGYCLIFRLAPHNYHRYIFIDTGLVEEQVRIDGVLHCIRPLACDRFPVYIQNSREYTMLQTKHFGKIIQMEIGALLVGRIHNYQNSIKVNRGQEKGYFEFGGSTILLLFKKNAVELKECLKKNIGTGKEMQVSIGDKIGNRTGDID